MKFRSAFIQPFDQLPQTLAVFPLSNAMMLPGGYLPLNIFEPRYLNMLKDAMSNHQLIGMIQPRDDSDGSALYDVGCAGRITRYEEMHNGCIEIVLTGVCRFKTKEELNTTRGYRLVVPDWSNYERDYEKQILPTEISQNAFRVALKKHFNEHKIDADWDILNKMDVEELANSLFGYLPLNTEDKQLLLEVDTFENRLTAFTAILDSKAQPSVEH